MSKNSKIDKDKNSQTRKKAPSKAATMGRKRDPKLDDAILDSALNILAEKGFDRMTMDMVAAKAKSGKATLYRRWPSKPELVRDALIFMSKNSIDNTQLPDTGNLKKDLVAIVKPHSLEHSQRKVRVLSKLGSFFSDHQKFGDEAIKGIFAPWEELNRILIKRAIDRGEISNKTNIDLICEIISAMTSYKVNFQRTTFAKANYEQLLDDVLLPAMKS